MSKTFLAIATITGVVIGAGILGIPYVVMKSGFLLGFINIIIVFVISLIAMLYLGEIGLRTEGRHQLTGYAERYLGNKGRIVMAITVIFGIYSALLAYLIGGGKSLSQLVFNSDIYFLPVAIILWVIFAAICYRGLKAIGDSEEIGMTVVFVLIISISVYLWNKIDLSNLTYSNMSNALLPFGVVLFAFSGFVSIPIVIRELGKDGKYIKNAIIISEIFVFIIYSLFALVVLGAHGSNTPEIATITLGKVFILLGTFTMSTSYLALSLALQETFQFDFKQSRKHAWFYTQIIPLLLIIILSLIDKAQFILVLSIGGLITGSLEATLVLLMIGKAKKHGDKTPAYSVPYSKILIWLFIAMFITAALFEIIRFFI